MLMSSQTLAGSRKYISLLSISTPAKVCGLWAIFMRYVMDITERQLRNFWAKVDKSGECWLWTGSTSQGYGYIGIGKGRQRSHRVSWFLVNGYIPKGMQINHHCDVRNCVNPEHLYAGTQRQNVFDMVSRFRQGKQKIKESDIPIIMSYKGKLKRKEVGDMYGVHETTIGDISTGRKWSHISGITYVNSALVRRRGE